MKELLRLFVEPRAEIGLSPATWKVIEVVQWENGMASTLKILAQVRILFLVTFISRLGGIGRHAGFRFQCFKRESSNLSVGIEV